MTKPKSKKAATRSASRKTSKSESRTGSAPSSSKTTTRPATKHARIIAMLRAPAGATVAALMTATDWQQHSVRGFLAGVVRKKLGLNLVSEQNDKGRVYRIKEGKGSPASTADATDPNRVNSANRPIQCKIMAIGRGLFPRRRSLERSEGRRRLPARRGSSEAD